MSLRYAILGFLAERSLTGYELKKGFDSSVRFFWPADQSQIYRTLSALSNEGLISFLEEPSNRVMDLKRYSITQSGREQLLNWLGGPLVDQPVRDAGLIQAFFFGQLQPADQLRQVRALKAQLTEYQAVYSSLMKGLEKSIGSGSMEASAFFKIAAIEYGLRQVCASLDWAESLEERLVSGELRVLSNLIEKE